jgi:hypothetical protein
VAKGIFLVETYPISKEREADYNRWYDDEHLPAVVAIEGFVAARRFAGLTDDGGPFVAVYEVEAENLEAVAEHLVAMVEAGVVSGSATLQRQPAPKTRWLRQIAEVRR